MPFIQAKSALLLIAVFVAFGVPAQAMLTVCPVSYDTPNGDSSRVNHYWDDSYSGLGTKNYDGAMLTGGTGDLTDGIVAAASFNEVEGQAGPYVGWEGHIFNGYRNPLITFHFAHACTWESIRIHLDDADGLGDVDHPSAVIIEGFSFAVDDPAGTGPFWAVFDVTGLGLTTDTLTIQLIRSDNWVFASEFAFIGNGSGDDCNPSVPAPSALLLGGLGSGLFSWMRRRRLA